MKRRDFLALATPFMLTTVLGLANPAAAAVKKINKKEQGQLYKGTNDGKIFRTRDGGKTWELIADFGDQCSVRRIFTRWNGTIIANLAYSNHTFKLYSEDEKNWRPA